MEKKIRNAISATKSGIVHNITILVKVHFVENWFHDLLFDVKLVANRARLTG